ncbi:MAG: glycosyltransferase family A protein, partial [Sulfuricurvum sp.]|nr:glycosyltransferase family A protein [Sulfuricurvum sp.]
NKEQYVERTLRSILSQTYQDYEIVIVDDGSTDNSLSIVRSFDDARIRIIQQKNAGVSAARNRGIAEARYDLIAFLDADDEWLPNYLETIKDLENDFSECHVFATNYKIVDSNTNERFPVNTELLKVGGERGILINYFDAAARTAPPIWTSAVVVRKSALENIGGFPVGIPMGEDLLTWARLACKYPIAYSKTVTAIYHFYTLSEMMNPWKKPDDIDLVGMELRKLIDHCHVNDLSLKRYIALWHKMRLKEAMKCGEKRSSLKEMREILRFDRMQYKSYILVLLAFLPQFIRRMILITFATYQARSVKKGKND